MLVREGIKSQIEGLKKEKAELLAIVASIDEALKALEGDKDKPMDWKNLAFRCLKSHPFPLRTVDLLNCIFYDEPEKLKDPIKRRNYINALAIALNTMCEYKFLDRTTVPGYKGYFYGIANLFVSPGELQKFVKENLMHELLYNPNSVFYLGEKIMNEA